MIQQLHQKLNSIKSDPEIHWLIILTNQVDWMKNNEFRIGVEGWKEKVASDGCWWQWFLEKWFNKNGYSYSLVDLFLKSEIENGVANWDEMAKMIAPLFNDKIKFKDSKVFLNNETDPYDKLIIQHSSGTPALSSALYLWGIEQKLAGASVEFAYLSDDEKTFPIHEGSHWKWRLKKPQVMKLLELQHFDGAIQLLGSDCPDEKTLKSLKQLDKRSAFNLIDLSLSPQDDVLERIAIALWTEKSFRKAGQWMNWYLRVAGAMELALFCLVEQRSEDFKWQKGKLKIILYHPYDQYNVQGFGLPIKKVVYPLLSKGECYKPQSDPPLHYKVNKIKNDRWQDFSDFYCPPEKRPDLGWKLDNNIQDGFTYIRNSLYHSLSGDRLDELLDKQTQKLGSADDPAHPAHKAVGYLLYLLELGNLKPEVMSRREALKQQEKNILTTLETLA